MEWPITNHARIDTKHAHDTDPERVVADDNKRLSFINARDCTNNVVVSVRSSESSDMTFNVS